MEAALADAAAEVMSGRDLARIGREDVRRRVCARVCAMAGARLRSYLARSVRRKCVPVAAGGHVMVAVPHPPPPRRGPHLNEALIVERMI